MMFAFLIMFFIIRSRHQLVFDVGGDWSLIQLLKTLSIDLTRTHNSNISYSLVNVTTWTNDENKALDIKSYINFVL